MTETQCESVETKTLSLFTRWLRTEDDMECFIDEFENMCSAADSKVTRHTYRNLWHTLTGSPVCRNIYRLQMPFVVRAMFRSKANGVTDLKKYTAFVIPDEYGECAHMAQAVGNAGMFLVSAKLSLQIKANPTDVKPLRSDIWLPPRDFEVLCETLPPNPPCYVELFLHDFRYAGAFIPKKNAAARTTLLHYALSKSPSAVQEAWANFKEVFFAEAGAKN
jgi:hypothetical protein